MKFVEFRAAYGSLQSSKLKTVFWLRANLSKRVWLYTCPQLWDPDSKHTIFYSIEHDISGSTFNEKNLIMTIIRWNIRTPSKNRMDTMYKREEGDKLHCMGR
jgi:hypothetical protein